MFVGKFFVESESVFTIERGLGVNVENGLQKQGKFLTIGNKMAVTFCLAHFMGQTFFIVHVLGNTSLQFCPLIRTCFPIFQYLSVYKPVLTLASDSAVNIKWKIHLELKIIRRRIEKKLRRIHIVIDYIGHGITLNFFTNFTVFIIST